MTQSHLTIVPMKLADAKAYVLAHHRHRPESVGHKFSLGVVDDTGALRVDDTGALRGAAMVGRPVAAAADGGWTLEVTRLATDGCENACSALYGAAWRATKALGYLKLITYTLKTEPGTSLRAAGYQIVGEVKPRPRGWNCSARPRADDEPTAAKFRWEPAS